METSDSPLERFLFSRCLLIIYIQGFFSFPLGSPFKIFLCVFFFFLFSPSSTMNEYDETREEKSTILLLRENLP